MKASAQANQKSTDANAFVDSIIAVIKNQYPHVREDRVRDAILEPDREAPPAPAQGLLDVAASIDYVGLGRTSLWRLEKKGILPVVRLGSRRFHLVADLDKLIARARKGAVRIRTTKGGA